MKTSKEMQLKVIDEMRGNVDSDQHVYTNIQVRGKGVLSGWLDKGDSYLDFWNCEHRVKPQTITINGVEIPKPLTERELIELRPTGAMVYRPEVGGSWYGVLFSDGIELSCYPFLYSTKEQAIEVSKALFGIKD